MTLFQILAISVLMVLLIRELTNLSHDPTGRFSKILRAVVWLAAALAIARPSWVQSLAESVGIQRGADLVFYLFVLAFLGVSFYFYSRFVRMQRQLTQMVRHTALQEARRGGENVTP